jgi:hypothetical protein
MLGSKILKTNGEEITSTYPLYLFNAAYYVYSINQGEAVEDLPLPNENSDIGLFVTNFLAQIRSSSVADHFASCVNSFISFVNGDNKTMSSLLSIVEKLELNKDNKISLTQLVSMAIPNFLFLLSVHPSFTDDHKNHNLFQKLNKLMLECGPDTTQPSFIYYFIELINQFKITGISDIALVSDESLNQQYLDAVNFPQEAIPERFICSLTAQAMTTPCFVSNVYVDFSKFITACERNKSSDSYINCYDKRELELADFSDFPLNNELKKEIELLVTKVQWLFSKFNKRHQASYKKYQSFIVDSGLSLQDFQSKFQKPTTACSSALYQEATKDRDLVDMSKNAIELSVREAAAAGSVVELTRLLSSSCYIDKQITIDAQDRESGCTALHLVIINASQQHTPENNYKSCYELLIQKGASSTIQDANGLTADDYMNRDATFSTVSLAIKASTNTP